MGLNGKRSFATIVARRFRPLRRWGGGCFLFDRISQLAILTFRLYLHPRNKLLVDDFQRKRLYA